MPGQKEINFVAKTAVLPQLSLFIPRESFLGDKWGNKWYNQVNIYLFVKQFLLCIDSTPKEEPL
jgi:hypothetical protein